MIFLSPINSIVMLGLYSKKGSEKRHIIHYSHAFPLKRGKKESFFQLCSTIFDRKRENNKKGEEKDRWSKVFPSHFIRKERGGGDFLH